MEEKELLGREIDFEGFEIEILMELVRKEIQRKEFAVKDHEIPDLENILDKLTNP
jgi:hypothetical protein